MIYYPDVQTEQLLKTDCCHEINMRTPDVYFSHAYGVNRYLFTRGRRVNCDETVCVPINSRCTFPIENQSLKGLGNKKAMALSVALELSTF